jgi:hypothetical protein
VSNTINNRADIGPNIYGPYTPNGATFNPRLTISDVSTLEGNTGTHAITFTVSASAASSQPITVAYGTATTGNDYQAASGTLTIPAGRTTGTITVLVNGDGLTEPNETISINLTSPNKATIADGHGVGIIVNCSGQTVKCSLSQRGSVRPTSPRMQCRQFAPVSSIAPRKLGKGG